MVAAKKSMLAKMVPHTAVQRSILRGSGKCQVFAYRKSLLDVVTAECASAVLDAAEKKRNSLGLKTVGSGPSAADRSEKQSVNMAGAREASTDAIQQIVENAEAIIDDDYELETGNIENAQHQFKINTNDTHSADIKHQTKQKSKQVK